MRISCPALEAQPGIAHGFFTRRGGVSAGLYSSLNCGFGSGDDMAHVAENRRRASHSIGAETISTLYQIHSNNVVITDKPIAEKIEADALVTGTPGIAIGILTADCLPVLLADPIAKVVACAHAGWKGAFSGILENTLAAMAQLGAQAKNIAATIGPAIAQGSYEVGEEFYVRFIEQEAENKIYFLHGARPGHFLFDLKSYAKDRLKNAGVAQINMLAHDTCFEDNDFFSYRRATLGKEPAYGRQLSAIILKE